MACLLGLALADLVQVREDYEACFPGSKITIPLMRAPLVVTDPSGLDMTLNRRSEFLSDSHGALRRKRVPVSVAKMDISRVAAKSYALTLGWR